MARDWVLLVVVLASLFASGTGQTLTNIIVNNPGDGSTCTQQDCTLGGALLKAARFPNSEKRSTNIILDVDVVLSVPIELGGAIPPMLNEVVLVPNVGRSRATISCKEAANGQATHRMLNWINFYGTFQIINVTISGFVHSTGYDDSYGGALSLTGINGRPRAPSHTELVLDGAVFENNGLIVSSPGIANAYGGAIGVDCSHNLDLQSCHIKIKDSTFTGNTITGAGGVGFGAYAYGGAVYSLRGFINITNSKFAQNEIISGDVKLEQAGQGGAVATTGPLGMWVVGSTFQDNRAYRGAAVYSQSDLHFDGTMFMGNDAPKNFALEKPSGVVEGAHLHFESSTLMSSPKILAALSPDDQYYGECKFQGSQNLVIGGYAIYNRNPKISSNGLGYTNGTIVAGCAGAEKWFPCPSGSSCHAVSNSTGDPVGYSCA